MKKHTFVICAYKESPYLEECIQSLKKQEKASELLLVTSTPCEYIENICNRHAVPMKVNTGESGITQDWNFGLEQVQTKYATIAHQDDIYEKEYTKKLIDMMEKYDDALISFSDYAELRKGEKVSDTSMLRIKRLMLFPLRFKCFWKSRWVRRRVLSLGDPICCPAVTFNLEKVKRPVFSHGFRSCEDWEAWEKLSKLKGRFIYCKEALMCHRIHEGSATTAILEDNARVEENYIMYCKFWPRPIARILNHFYTGSEKSNQLS